MKKVISFVLAALMLVSAVPTALATNDYTQGTQVVYTATGSESYTITVPAQLAPGGNGTVTLQGTWADNRIITVTAEPTVTLTNSIKAEDQKVLNVHFDGISEAGSNIGSQTFTEGVSVDDITNALFGTWSGKFNYNVDVTDTFATETASGSYVFVNDVSPSQHDLTVNLSSDTITDFSSVSATRYSSNLLDVSSLLKNNFVDNGDGTYTFTRIGAPVDDCYSNYQNVFFPKGTPIYASVNPIENTLSQGVLYISYVFEDGTKELKPLIQRDNVQSDYEPNEYTHTFDKNIVKIAIMCTTSINEVGDYLTFSEPKINIGQARVYENYVAPQTVTANADGSVSGLTSISPNMTIITNNSDVEITCEYQKKN